MNQTGKICLLNIILEMVELMIFFMEVMGFALLALRFVLKIYLEKRQKNILGETYISA